MPIKQVPVIAAINSGSSSLKFGLFSKTDPPVALISGKMTGIGSRSFTWEIQKNGRNEKILTGRPVNSGVEAANALLDWFRDKSFPPLMIGHRVVHGGEKFLRPAQIDSQLIQVLLALQSFAPLHMPPSIDIIRTFVDRLPNVQQYACFDTSFHADMPVESRHYAIPRKFREKGLVRYGFHGISCDYIYTRLTEMIKQAETRKILVAHLGSGASITAIEGGRSIDNTMGFSPTGGLVMNTRPGDLDPGLVCYMQKELALDSDQLENIFNRESGLKAIAGAAYDMEQLLSRESEDESAREAIAMYCYHIKKQIAAMAAALRGIDILVFTGGVGEHAYLIRQRVCHALAFMGIELDIDSNEQSKEIISRGSSRVQVLVLPTDEEWMIAQYLMEISRTAG